MSHSKLKEYMQSLEEIKNEEPEEPAMIEGGDDSMEAELLAVQEAESESEAADEIVEELDEVAEGMESIQASLEASLENGGLTAEASEGYRLALAAYTGRLGLDGDVIPSQEAFGGATDRESATQVSVEAVKDKLKAIWEAIKNAVVKAWNALKNFLAKIFGGAEKMSKRTVELGKAVKAIPSDKKAQGKISVSGAHYFGTKNELKGSDVASAVSEISGAVAYAHGDYVDGVASYYESAAYVMTLASSDEEAKVEDAIKAANEAAGATMKAASEKMKELPGGRKFTYEEGKEGATGSLKFVGAGEDKSSETAEIAALSTSDMTKVLAEVAKMAEAITKKKDMVKKVEKARDDAMKAGDKLVQESDRGKLGKAWDKAKAKRALKGVQKNLLAPVTQLDSYAFKAGRAALSVVEKSVKAYK